MKIFISLFAVISMMVTAMAQDAINTKCPISGGDVDAAHTLTIQKAVSFCCGKCLGKYEKDPAAMAKKVIAAESQDVNALCPITGKANSKSVMVKGQSVGVCCGKCAKKVAAQGDDFEVEADQPATAKCIVSGADAKAGKTATADIKVAFCCGKCVAKAKKDPGSVLSKL